MCESFSLQWPLQLVSQAFCLEQGGGCFRLRVIHTQLCFGQGFWMEDKPPLVDPSSCGEPHPTPKATAVCSSVVQGMLASASMATTRRMEAP